jgi:hypothetical protein
MALHDLDIVVYSDSKYGKLRRGEGRKRQLMSAALHH